ncbi:MAG: cysteine hydrolase [Nitrospiraceae bacterium]|nr:cysteine hydrolase [Nitrospiraceae bacterium]
MAKEALLVLDMLNDFVRRGAPLEVPANRGIIAAVQREIKKARRKGNPVIYVCDNHTHDDKEFSKYNWPPHGVRGSEGQKVIEELKPRAGDIIIKKTYYSAFYKTKLQAVLKKLGVDTLRLTGCLTHICVLFTAYEAALRDFGVIVVKDGVADLTRDYHESALRIMQNTVNIRLE